MFRFSHKTLIYLCGFLWFVIGTALLTLGLRFLVESGKELHDPLPLLNWIYPLVGDMGQASALLIGLALAIGFLKGRFVFKKSVDRIVSRIRSFPEPMSVGRIYSLPYFLLMGSMVFLGIAIKYFAVPYDVRGMLDVAVGAALINGAKLYFRQATVAV